MVDRHKHNTSDKCSVRDIHGTFYEHKEGYLIWGQGGGKDRLFTGPYRTYKRHSEGAKEVWGKKILETAHKEMKKQFGVAGVHGTKQACGRK